MKRTTLRALSLALLAVLAVAPAARAQAFHKYVALGDSLTAGVEGGCLVARHQLKSYPKLIADAIGITDFQQPLVNEKALTSPLTGTACLGATLSGTNISAGPVSQSGAPANLTLARPYDNLGLPGANAADLVDLTTANPAGNTANQSAALILRNFPGGPFVGKSAVDEANLLNPDLVSIWIGPNDVLGAALSGVALDGVTLTTVSTFTTKYNAIVNAVKGTGRTLVVANIPDVTVIPFVSTIPPVVVNPVTRQPVLVNGNPVPLLGSRTQPGCATAPCQIPSNTLVTLGASALLAQGIGIPTALGGTGIGLPDGSVDATGLHQGVLLYADEVSAIRTRGSELNGVIASVASANGAILVDMNAVLNDAKANGYEIGGITLTTSFLQGGIFSADGIHPSNLGYAITADEFILAINAAKGTAIPEPNFSTIFFTPHVPVVPTPSRTSGPFGFPADAGFRLLEMFPPVDGETAILPPEGLPERSPRVVRGRN